MAEAWGELAQGPLIRGTRWGRWHSTQKGECMVTPESSRAFPHSRGPAKASCSPLSALVPAGPVPATFPHPGWAVALQCWGMPASTEVTTVHPTRPSSDHANRYRCRNTGRVPSVLPEVLLYPPSSSGN